MAEGEPTGINLYLHLHIRVAQTRIRRI